MKTQITNQDIELFLEGKHKGEKYMERDCAIAKDDKYLLGGRDVG